MPQRVNMDLFINTCPPRRYFYRMLDTARRHFFTIYREYVSFTISACFFHVVEEIFPEEPGNNEYPVFCTFSQANPADPVIQVKVRILQIYAFKKPKA